MSRSVFGKTAVAAALLASPMLSAPITGKLAAANADISLGVTSESTVAVKATLDRNLPLERFHERLSLRLSGGLLLLSSEKQDGNAALLLSPALRWTLAGDRSSLKGGSAPRYSSRPASNPGSSPPPSSSRIVWRWVYPGPTARSPWR